MTPDYRALPSHMYRRPVVAIGRINDVTNRTHTALKAQPEPAAPVVLTDDAIEQAAKLIYASMRFAVPDNHYTRDWVERGNSLMQDEARRTARAVLAAALQAFADQARRGPEHWEGFHPDDFDNGWNEAMSWVAIIAAELDGTTTTPAES